MTHLLYPDPTESFGSQHQLVSVVDHPYSALSIEPIGSLHVAASVLKIGPGKVKIQVMDRAFTLVELLIVISLVAILAGLVLGGAMAVRESSRRVQAQSLIPMLDQALRVYRQEDILKRFPTPPASGWIEFAASGAAPALGDALAGCGFTEVGSRRAIAGVAGKAVVDPWNQAVEYRLDALMDGAAQRPLDEDGVAVQVPGDVDDWNPRGIEPYAYVWSWGRPRAGTRKHVRARDWIYVRQDPKP